MSESRTECTGEHDGFPCLFELLSVDQPDLFDLNGPKSISEILSDTIKSIKTAHENETVKA